MKNNFFFLAIIAFVISVFKIDAAYRPKDEEKLTFVASAISGAESRRALLLGFDENNPGILETSDPDRVKRMFRDCNQLLRECDTIAGTFDSKFYLIKNKVNMLTDDSFLVLWSTIKKVH